MANNCLDQILLNKDLITTLQNENKKLREQLSYISKCIDSYEKSDIVRNLDKQNYPYFANRALVFLIEKMKSLRNSSKYLWDDYKHDKQYCENLLFALKEWEKQGFKNEPEHFIHAYKDMMNDLQKWLQ